MRIIYTLYKIKKEVLFVLLVSLSLSTIAQDGYKKVDSTTHSFYDKAQWKELISYGKANDLDYYNFNLRMGIAFYARNQFFEAEEYFQRAITNNETDFATKYLFWTYLQMGERNIAEQTYDKLSDTLKSQIGFENKIIESVYLELGAKFPDEYGVGELFYGSLVLKHNIVKNLKLTHSFTPFTQINTSHEDITNLQYNAFVNYQLKNTNIGIGGMFAVTNLSANFTFQTYLEKQEIRTVTNSYYLNVNHRIKRLKLNLNINYTPQNIQYTNTYTPSSGGGNPPGDPTIIKSDSNRTAFIPSVGLVYFPKFLKDKIAIGSDVFMVSTNGEIKYVWKPMLSVIFSDKIWLNTSYLEINHQLFSDYSTNIMYNISQETKRFSGTLSYLVTPKIILNATYLFEAIHDNLSDNYYNLNSVFIGVKINL